MASGFSNIIDAFTNNLIAERRYLVTHEARLSICPQVKQFIEEPTIRGFRIKLIV